MKHTKLLWCAIILQQVSLIDATTLVYSTRIRRVFELGADTALEGSVKDKQKKSNFIASAVPIVYARERHIVQPELGVDVHEDTLIGGAVLNVRYSPSKCWWWEVTTGIEKEHMTLEGTSRLDVCRTGFDDFIFSGGYNIFPDSEEKMECRVYGLLGVPARRKVTAQEFTNTLVGTRFLSLGGGIECSYTCINELQRSSFVLAQVRFIHFFERTWFPILPCTARIRPGNTTDILLTVQHREGRNIFETGYNPTFFTNQAVVTGAGDIARLQNYVRHSLYASFAHVCKNESNPQTPIILGTGLSIAWANRFSTQICSWWLSVSKVF